MPTFIHLHLYETRHVAGKSIPTKGRIIRVNVAHIVYFHVVATEQQTDALGTYIALVNDAGENLRVWETTTDITDAILANPE